METGLKFSRNIYREVDYGILESYINETLKPKSYYEIPCDLECSNDSYHVIRITGKDDLDGYDANKYHEWLAGKPQVFMIWTLMQVMVNMDYIEAGAYLIHVSW